MRSPTLALVLAVFACVIAAAWWTLRDGPERVPRGFEATTDLRERRENTRPSLATPSAPVERAELDDSTSASAPANVATLLARFVDERGTPIEGVIADLGASVWPGATLAEMRAVLSVRVTSDREGRVELRFVPPAERALRLDVVARKRIDRAWDALRIAPGETKDFGDVVLPLGATVVTRVVDARGKPIVRGWSLQLEQRPRADGSVSRRSRSEADLVNGVAQLENVEPARWTATVRFGKAVTLPRQEIDLAPGETRSLEFVHAAYDPPDTITVVVTATSNEIARGVNAITLLRPDGTQHPAVPGTSSRAFDDVGDGRYSVVIDDPRFVTWRKDGVEAGEIVHAKLVGSAAVTLSVFDARTGKPIDRYGLDARLADAVRGVASTRVRAWDDPPSRDGLYEGLVPVPQTLVVSSPGYANAEIPLLDLAPGNTRALVVRLSEGASLRGVVRTRGTLAPVAAAEISLLARDVATGEPIRAGQFKRTQTDADGRFAFVLVGDGAWVVEARTSTFASARAALDVLDGVGDGEVVLELPESAVVSGRIVGPESAAFESFKIAVVPIAHGEGAFEKRERTEAAVELDAKGAFRTAPTPLGRARVLMRVRDGRVGFGTRGPLAPIGDIDLGTIEVTANASEHVIDARHVFPGSIDVEVDVRGAAAGAVSVRATSIETAGDRGDAVVNDSGRARLDWLAPGSYRLSVGAIKGAWRVEDPRVHVVPASGKIDVRIEVELVERDLVVVDAQGAPLARAALRIAHEGDLEAPTDLRADADGRVKLLLATGRYVIGLHDRFRDAPATRTSFEWTSSGPSSERIVLVR